VADPSPHAQTFAEALQRVLDEQGISNRELARRLAGTREEKAVAGRRRQIVRWLNGETANPTRATRRTVAVALGLEPDYFLTAARPSDVLLARLGVLEKQVERIEQLLGVDAAPSRSAADDVLGRPGAAR
jgi:transcriptional regulator with XRE-family HTH domain